MLLKRLLFNFKLNLLLTGTFVVNLHDMDNNRLIHFNIQSILLTLGKKIITFTADTTGTLTNDNNLSMRLSSWLSAGTDYTSGTYSEQQSRQSTDVNRAVGQVLFTGGLRMIFISLVSRFNWCMTTYRI